MKNLSLLCILIFLTNCAPNSSSLSPSPGDLANKPFYKEQVVEIDRSRFELEQKSFGELLEEGRVTKDYNGTPPIVVAVERTKVPDEGSSVLDENGDEIIEPINDKQEVEEFYITADTDEEAAVPVADKSETTEVEDNQKELPAIEITTEEDSPELIEEKTSEVLEAESTPDTITYDEEIDLSPTEQVEDQEVSISTNSNDVEKPDDESVDDALSTSLRPQKRPENFSMAYKADWDGRSTAETYTKYTLDALEKYGVNLLNPEVKSTNHRRYCKSYNSLERDERKRFWLMMISGLSRLESGFRSHTKYTEGFKVSDTSDVDVVSRGLLQLSIDSIKSRKYKCNSVLGIKTTEDLHDPQKNLACAVIIMNYWMLRDKKMYGYEWMTCDDGSEGCRRWFGVGRYWGPIRIERYENKSMTSSQKNRHEERKDLGRKTNRLNFCR